MSMKGKSAEVIMKYAKMCKDAKIQSLWKPEVGRYYEWWDMRFDEMRSDIFTEEGLNDVAAFKYDFIWMPTASELIDLIVGKIVNNQTRFSTIEQLGLAVFLMICDPQKRG